MLKKLLEILFGNKINRLPETQEVSPPLSAEDDYTLTKKQLDYALTMINRLQGTYELAVDPSALKVKDLNRLVAYFRFKNKGTLVNLEKKGVLRKVRKTESL